MTETTNKSTAELDDECYNSPMFEAAMEIVKELSNIEYRLLAIGNELQKISVVEDAEVRVDICDSVRIDGKAPLVVEADDKTSKTREDHTTAQ